MFLQMVNETSKRKRRERREGFMKKLIFGSVGEGGNAIAIAGWI